jgi:uncharacterized protein
MDRPDETEQVAAALSVLPIFPLSGVVFFPHTLLPLHIFEPRYRQLTEHILKSHQCLAITLVADEALPEAMVMASPAATPVAVVAGLGRVVHHERLADGRFHILVQGIGRVRFLTELPRGDLLFRRVEAARFGETTAAAADDADIASELSTLRSCYARLLQHCPEQRESLGDLPLRLSDPTVIADIVCATLLEDVCQRQLALAEPRVLQRLRVANDAVAQLLLRSLAPDSLLN